MLPALIITYASQQVMRQSIGRDTMLILCEGLPGSGKSTMGQWLWLLMRKNGIPARWLHEEQPHHPLYPFYDQATLSQFLAAIEQGHHNQVIEKVLHHWRVFIESLCQGRSMVVLDSCLYMYMSWCLYQADLPDALIIHYIRAVSEAIQPAGPRMVYFQQRDLASALRQTCDQRGPDLEQLWITTTTQSPRGRRVGWQGFAGMVACRTAYRTFIESVMERLPVSSVVVDTSAGDWPEYRHTVQTWLGLPNAAGPPPSQERLLEYVGNYRCSEMEPPLHCAISVQQGQLTASALPGAWQGEVPLIPGPADMPDTFHARSWPFDVTFERDVRGRICVLVAGDHHWGRHSRVYDRQSDSGI